MAYLRILLAALLLAPVARADDHVRAEIERTLAAMSRAVLDLDEPAFLRHIAPDEPNFLQEQRMWFRQLHTHPPDEFSLAIDDGQPSLFTPDRAEFPLLMSWTISSGPPTSWGAGGKPRSALFPTVIFTRSDDLWLCRGEKWQRLPGDNFTVLFLPGAEPIARDVLAAFPVAKAHVDAGFQIENHDPQIIKLFASMDHLKATVYISMPDHYLGGWNEVHESIKFMQSYTSGVAGWTAAFAHEYGHVATWTLGPDAPGIPWWVAEGVAELAAEGLRPGYRRWLEHEIRAAACDGRLAGWDAMHDYFTTAPELKMLAYTQGHHMLGYISDRFGRDARNAWLAALCHGATLDKAGLGAFGMTFTDLDAQWREHLLEPPRRVGRPRTSP